MILESLAANGLTALYNVVKKKGTEFIKDKFGVDIEDALQTPEGLAKLRELEFNHQEKLIELENEGQAIMESNITERHKSDMNSDSILSKNIRPVSTLLLVLATIVAVYVPSVSDNKLSVIAWLTGAAIGFYFNVRSLVDKPIAAGKSPFSVFKK